MLRAYKVLSPISQLALSPASRQGYTSLLRLYFPCQGYTYFRKAATPRALIRSISLSPTLYYRPLLYYLLYLSHSDVYSTRLRCLKKAYNSLLFIKYLDYLAFVSSLSNYLYSFFYA